MQILTIAVHSAGMLLREGLAATLVIAGLAGLLRRAGASDQVPALYVGACFGIMARFEAAFIVAAFFDGAQDDRINDVLLILASFLLVYVSGWLFVQRNADDWDWPHPRVNNRMPLRFAAVAGTRASLRAGRCSLGRAWATPTPAHRSSVVRSAERAAFPGTSLALAGIAFLMVFRAGGESASFVQTLAESNGAGKSGLIGGVMVASCGLLVLVLAIQWLALRLPLRPMLAVTSALLFVTGLGLIGAAAG